MHHYLFDSPLEEDASHIHFIRGTDFSSVKRWRPRRVRQRLPVQSLRGERRLEDA